METSQKNFTTPEQSKQLFELGVPVDSADCYYNTDGENIGVLPNNTTFSEFNKSIKRVLGKELFPCWSFGRLIRIYDHCAHGFYTLPKVPQNLIKHIISRYDWEIRHVGMDFSKLEE